MYYTRYPATKTYRLYTSWLTFIKLRKLISWMANAHTDIIQCIFRLVLYSSPAYILFTDLYIINNFISILFYNLASWIRMPNFFRLGQIDLFTLLADMHILHIDPWIITSWYSIPFYNMVPWIRVSISFR